MKKYTLCSRGESIHMQDCEKGDDTGDDTLDSDERINGSELDDWDWLVDGGLQARNLNPSELSL